MLREKEACSEQLPTAGKQRLYEEIAAFAEACARTDLDLDEDLEQAGIEVILDDGEDRL